MPEDQEESVPMQQLDAASWKSRLNDLLGEEHVAHILEYLSFR